MPSNILFIEISASECETVAQNGLGARGDRKLRLMSAPALLPNDDSATCILAIDGNMLDVQMSDVRFFVDVESVPPAAILNINPWMPIKAVPAAGGIILRERHRDREIVSIFRNGVWDLPKGKIDANETPPDAAVREVREEIGISDVRIVADLGTTLHGYAHKDRYCIKTTYWYQMVTPETAFTPQTDEGIEDVSWITWTNAKSMLGYDNLRDLLERIERRGMLVEDF